MIDKSIKKIIDECLKNGSIKSYDDTYAVLYGICKARGSISIDVMDYVDEQIKKKRKE